jgi:hypothetical protein
MPTMMTRTMRWMRRRAVRQEKTPPQRMPPLVR